MSRKRKTKIQWAQTSTGPQPGDWGTLVQTTEENATNNVKPIDNYKKLYEKCKHFALLC